MTANAEALLQKALSLSAEDRAELADRLLESLGPEYEAEIDAAWAQELDRRIKACEQGTAKLIPGEEVFARLARLFPGKEAMNYHFVPEAEAELENATAGYEGVRPGLGEDFAKKSRMLSRRSWTFRKPGPRYGRTFVVARPNGLPMG